MRRCYKCGVKKQDDKILCEKCERELNERLVKKNGQRTSEDRTDADIRVIVE